MAEKIISFVSTPIDCPGPNNLLVGSKQPMRLDVFPGGLVRPDCPQVTPGGICNPSIVNGTGGEICSFLPSKEKKAKESVRCETQFGIVKYDPENGKVIRYGSESDELNDVMIGVVKISERQGIALKKFMENQGDVVPSKVLLALLYQETEGKKKASRVLVSQLKRTINNLVDPGQELLTHKENEGYFFAPAPEKTPSMEETLNDGVSNADPVLPQEEISEEVSRVLSVDTKFGPIDYSPKDKIVSSRYYEGPLSEHEGLILECFLTNPDKVFTNEELRGFISERTGKTVEHPESIRLRVLSLRKKLENPNIIEAIRGYRIAKEDNA